MVSEEAASSQAHWTLSKTECKKINIQFESDVILRLCNIPCN